MTGRERVRNAMRYRPVDGAPLQYYYTPVGYYEHGERLNDLYASLPGDFGPFERMPVAGPSPEETDADGSYHAYRRDEWGTLWEYRIFGIAGIPKEYPLKDLSALDAYTFPSPPAFAGAELDALRARVAAHQRRHYFLMHAGSLYERLIALRPEADVLCDIALGEPAIHRLADRIAEHSGAFVRAAVASGADGVGFGDDYGTERGPIMSPEMWRGFIKPRLKALFEPAVKAGLDVHFHSCGRISPLLEDLREIGVTSVWPQLPAYNMEELAARCRSLGLAVAIHTDRARTMTTGTPQQVRDLVNREYDVFRMGGGGSWFYVEADNGFPFENIEALVTTIAQWR